MFAWLSAKLDAIVNWFLQLAHSIWSSFVDFLLDIPIKVLDLFLTAVAAVLNNISVPSFMSGGGMQSYVSGLHPTVQWALGQFGFGACLGVIAAGVGFRLLRKIFTLFQW